MLKVPQSLIMPTAITESSPRRLSKNRRTTGARPSPTVPTPILSFSPRRLTGSSPAAPRRRDHVRGRQHQMQSQQERATTL
jgi:hypothetical protein